MEIPIPISSKYVGQSHGHLSFIHDTTPQFHHHSNGPPLPPPTPLSTPTDKTAATSKKDVVAVKYRECLKNHAAAIGGNATDGCGEFMPSGEEGSLEALKCSACGCHRNFHRRTTDGDDDNNNCHHIYHLHQLNGRKLIGGNHHYVARAMPRSAIMPVSGAVQTSESDEMERLAPPAVKKRVRTKFSAEQKEKMLAFAERAGWRLQRQEEGEVQRFCHEIGVKRRVLKVWMHNNKHSLAKRAAAASMAEGFNETSRVEERDMHQ